MVADPVPAVELSRVSFGYGHGQRVLDAVDLSILPGEFVAIAGPNGGGKTTLLRLILGLERPGEGDVRLYGEPPNRSARRNGVGYLAQRAQLASDAPATVYEVVAAGCLATGRLLGPLGAGDRESIAEAIERVGLTHVAQRPLARLSGGQQQRAFIAKALASKPALLVLDEPTTGVDVEAQDALAALLHRLHHELQVTILFVSHEFGAVERFVERLVLVRGRIVFDGSPSELPGIWHDPSHVHL
ncbi:MAG: metal ABC transporter ATP-binding protein [Actinobacteria bacterium]|nr:metal ABC transporter ATP-binding protein [Actinomycetota bacterium]